jgi:hypothetical protein
LPDYDSGRMHTTVTLPRVRRGRILAAWRAFLRNFHKQRLTKKSGRS